MNKYPEKPSQMWESNPPTKSNKDFLKKMKNTKILSLNLVYLYGFPQLFTNETILRSK